MEARKWRGESEKYVRIPVAFVIGFRFSRGAGGFFIRMQLFFRGGLNAQDKFGNGKRLEIM